MAVDQQSLIRYREELIAGSVEMYKRLRWGSFADRNPMLGKMRTCNYCGVRRREFSGDVCCTFGPATSQRAWSEELGFYQSPCAPRESEWSKKQFMKKITHKRHSNLKRMQIHEMALLLQDDAFRNTTQLLLEGNPPFATPLEEIRKEHIPPFADRVVAYIRKQESNRKRKQQQLARRINFGLVRG